MPNTIRWGILATGKIAHQFAEGLKALPDAELAAVGSRAQASADAFGVAYNVPRRHASYEALAADPDVDIVYIATPHSHHASAAMLCLEAGKAVLCEKPFTINAAQAETLVAKARQSNLFLMEAMWTRFMPAMVELRRLVAAGDIGQPLMAMADFGFRAPVEPKGRLFDLALGGGALLDVGVYPVSFASMLFGEPVAVYGQAHLGETGVDELAGIVLKHTGGQIATLTTAIRARTPHEAHVIGTEGRIHIADRWWCPSALTVYRDGAEPRHVAAPFDGNGYNYEAAEAARCLREGLTESPIMPLDETLAIMRTLDALRAQWGLRYPME